MIGFLNDVLDTTHAYSTCFVTIPPGCKDYGRFNPFSAFKRDRNLLFIVNFIGTSILPNGGKILGYSLYENLTILLYNKFVAKFDFHPVSYNNKLSFNNNNYVIDLKDINYFNIRKMNLKHLFFGNPTKTLDLLMSQTLEEFDTKKKKLNDLNLSQIEDRRILANLELDIDKGNETLLKIIHKKTEHELKFDLIVKREEELKLNQNLIIEEIIKARSFLNNTLTILREIRIKYGDNIVNENNIRELNYLKETLVEKREFIENSNISLTALNNELALNIREQYYLQKDISEELDTIKKLESRLSHLISFFNNDTKRLNDPVFEIRYELDYLKYEYHRLLDIKKNMEKEKNDFRYLFDFIIIYFL